MDRRLYLLLIPIVLALVACADTTEAPSPNEPTSLERPTSTQVSPTRRIQPSTRDVDFSQIPEVRQAISRCTLSWRFQGNTSNLDVSPCRIASISYEDLVGDSREEATVQIAGVSGMGRQPVLTVFVYGYDESTLRMHLLKDAQTGPLWVYLADGSLAIGETLYEPTEAACCPSSSVLTTYTYGPNDLQRTTEIVACQSTHAVVGSIMCPRP